MEESDIQFVCHLAKRAGQLALSMRANLHVSEKAPGDRVTDADRAISKMLVEALAERFPDDLIVSEEGDRQQAASRRAWLIDPIDGTDQYVGSSDQFSVMIGLLVERKPAYGWVFQPTKNKLYFGGPQRGAWVIEADEPAKAVSPLPALETRAEIRLIIGKRDARSRPWLAQMPEVSMRFVGSMGVKVIWVLEDRSDMVAQLHGKMSVWDTAGPAALALGAGLEIASGDPLDGGLNFPERFEPGTFVQAFPIIVGRSGTLAWSRRYLSTDVPPLVES
jgi:3'-phosphoadenosine 5'-phosphosulfate (PAPS) 3'-phosphatase